MYGSGDSPDAIARDMNSFVHSSTFKSASNGEFAKMKELISSDSFSSYNHHEQNQNQNHHQIQRSEFGGQNGSSLTRYRSAPSSFFANIFEEIGCDDLLAPVNTTTSNHNPEEQIFSGHQQQPLQKFRSDSPDFLQYSSSSMKQQPKEAQIQQLDLSPVSAAMYGNGNGNGGSSQLVPPSNGDGVYNHHNNINNLESSSTFGSMNSTSSNLIRQSSSPAGFYSLTSENGFASMRDVEKTSISSTRLNNHISFSSGQSTAMFLPQIAENRNEINDSTFKSLKRTRDGDSTTLGRQNGISGHFTPPLVHHMSLPKTSSEMAVVEKILRFEQDSIPCKIRAKRGCATHPRSISERVRRSRITDRLNLLEELFPNMDKQTSRADKLDLAVQHIKDLQKELQTLKDARARCTCSSKQ